MKRSYTQIEKQEGEGVGGGGGREEEGELAIGVAH